MNNKYFLTIDSGGSKTKLSLYDEGGVLIKTDSTVGFGLATDCDKENLDLVCTLINFCNSYVVSVVVCNLGGKNKTQITNSIKKAIPSAKLKLFRESEGVVGVKLCNKYSAEVTLMAGTGSIAIAPVKDKVVISGGWGANIGDKGSGYQLGLNAIRLALEEIDGTEELSLLTKKLTGVSEQLKVETCEEYCAFRDRVRSSLYPLERAHIASFAKVVYASAKEGDEKAIALYKEVGLDLADIVISAIQKTGRQLNGVVVTGGMVNAKEFWQKVFEEKLKNKYGDIKVNYLANGIEEATLYMAKEIIKGE